MNANQIKSLFVHLVKQLDRVPYEEKIKVLEYLKDYLKEHWFGNSDLYNKMPTMVLAKTILGVFDGEESDPFYSVEFFAKDVVEETDEFITFEGATVDGVGEVLAIIPKDRWKEIEIPGEKKYLVETEHDHFKEVYIKDDRYHFVLKSKKEIQG